MRYGKTLAWVGALMMAATACEDKSDGGGASLSGDWVVPAPEPTESPGPGPNPGSSPAPAGNDLYTGPADVEKYVRKFVEDALIQGVNVLPDMANPKLEIRIESLDSRGSSVIGLCQTGTNTRRVTFDPDFWNSVSETQRELLAHHELGHCVLYRAHRTTKLESGTFASIMYPIIMSSSAYLGAYDYYQEELFAYGASGSPVEGVDPGEEVTHVCDQFFSVP